MRCKNCHYSLANLTGPPHRCPECGAVCDPKHPDTFHLLQCRTCGYPLGGRENLADNICPECGTAFDPANPETVINAMHERQMTKSLLWIWAFLFAVFGLPLLIAVLQDMLGS